MKPRAVFEPINYAQPINEYRSCQLPANSYWIEMFAFKKYEYRDVVRFYSISSSMKIKFRMSTYGRKSAATFCTIRYLVLNRTQGHAIPNVHAVLSHVPSDFLLAKCTQDRMTVVHSYVHRGSGPGQTETEIHGTDMHS